MTDLDRQVHADLHSLAALSASGILGASLAARRIRANAEKG
jgi:hypothetical protein